MPLHEWKVFGVTLNGFLQASPCGSYTMCIVPSLPDHGQSGIIACKLWGQTDKQQQQQQQQQQSMSRGRMRVCLQLKCRLPMERP